MNLKQLEVFLAVAETGSFSRGAEATFITQSTVSQHISALEQELGLKLLDRTGKGALPTEAGKILVKHARQVVAGVQEIHRAISRFKGLEDAVLKVGGSNIPGTYLIPEILFLIAKKHPGIHLTLIEGDSREILEKITRDEVEIGVIGSRFGDDAFTFTPFGSDSLRLVISRDHRWLNRPTVTVAELWEEPFVLREPGSGTGKTISEAFHKAHLDPSRLNIRAFLGSNEAVKHAVAGGLGVSFISEVSARKEVERGELYLKDVEGITIERSFYLVQRAGRELSPAAAAFRKFLLEVYKK